MNSLNKALIVDDEEKARLYLASILSELYPQLEIQLASTPAEALFIFKKQKFDVVFLDVEMPGMTGLELLEQLRANKTKTPVIYVSAYKQAEFIQKALRLDAIDYIDKPVNPTELDNAIKKAFEAQPLSIESKNKIIGSRFCLLTDIDERFSEPDEIIYFESLKRYSIAYFTDGTKQTVRHNITRLTEMLPSDCFLHVGRQYIINIGYIKYISKSNKSITLKNNGFEVVLKKIFPDVLTGLIKKHSLKNV